VTTRLWRIALTAPNEAAADVFAGVLDGLGAAISAFEIEPRGAWTIEAIVQAKPDGQSVGASMAMAALAAGLDEPALVIEPMPDIDWLKINQESFPPMRIGRYFVHGSHIKSPIPAGSIGLRIDAATAFGTGEHATTHGCLQALDRLARRGRRRRILDMGTGTGILAIAAAKTFRVPVLACDIDAHSVEVAAENIGVNRVSALVRAIRSTGYAATAVDRRAPYDLVFANILARPLIAMAPDLARVLAPGGVAILSGLLEAQEPMVTAAHRGQGLVKLGRIARKGWHTLIFEQRGA
jgi:ribosomal protein L11 methyltransferase